MNNQSKRVYALYRVSTLGQVEKDDIPMQKQACREFAERQGWEVVNEFSEKGVSGFKVSAKDRDAIQEIQRDAIEGKFDILLVFMFDRLGRRDDETPFVVEWFVKNGIEVWSAMEGQQRFDNHVDKLLNYIRYWQASGESIKTSVRVKTRMEQLTQDGHYTGGTVPYGYKMEQLGRTNKKNQAVADIVVDPEETEIIKLIFQKYVHEGYGTQRLCRYLSELGIKNKKGGNFPNTSINRIIKNIIYTGIIHNGECQAERNPALQIIDDDTFSRAQEMMKMRTAHHSSVPLNTKGQSLLVGNIYCGYCRNRLTLTTSGRKRENADGTIKREVRARYQCHYNVRHPGACEGQSGYALKKTDDLVSKIIRLQFEKIRAASADELVSGQHQKEIEFAKARYKLASNQYEEKKKDLDDLRGETIKVIRGTSKLDADLLNSLVGEATESQEAAELTLKAAKEELENCVASAETVRCEYAQLLSWADMYENCTFEAKKMIVAQFIKGVYVYRDYELEIEFNVSFEDFQTLCTSEAGEGSKKVEVQALQPSA